MEIFNPGGRVGSQAGTRAPLFPATGFHFPDIPALVQAVFFSSVQVISAAAAALPRGREWCLGLGF